ncbi:MAG: glycosyltransferase family 39 protein [Verrucomicrobiae bacterium]|nr:glycosyltransferase family 39 protein [Verrucomicrobiae bacterium]
MATRPLFQQIPWCILALGLLLRLGLFAFAAAGSGTERFFTPDSFGYHALAKTLLSCGEFSGIPHGMPELFRCPGYPAFIALGLAAIRMDIYGVILIQILLDVALCFLTFRLGIMLISRKTGVAASAIQAIFPCAVAASVRLLSETLFSFLFALALILILDRKKASVSIKTFSAGLLLGLACLVRPLALPLIILLPFFPAFRCRARWRCGAFIALGAALVLIPWMARNQIKTGYGQLSGVGDYNLLHYNAMALAQIRKDIELTPTWQKLVETAETSLKKSAPDPRNDPQYLRFCRQEGLNVIGSHPFAYAFAHLKTTLGVFLPPATEFLEVLGITTGNKGTLAVLQREGVRAAIQRYFGRQTWPLFLSVPIILLTLLIYCASLAGLLSLSRLAIRKKRLRLADWGFLVLIALFFILLPGPVAHARFLVPITPILSLLGAAGAAATAGRLDARCTTHPSLILPLARGGSI